MLIRRFKWVQLQLALFIDEDDPFTPHEAERKLNELETTSEGETIMKGLGEAYDAIYNRNIKKDDQRRQDAEKALKLICCSFRELTIEELLTAVAVNKHKIDTHVTRDYLLKKICSNFIVEGHNDTAQFAHQSVREYLKTRGKKQETDEYGEYSEAEAHSQAAETCLAYLNHCDTHISPITQGSGFPQYAVFYWAEHCKMTSEKKRKQGYLWKIFWDFLLKGSEGNAKFAEWTRAVRERPDKDDLDYFWFEFNPLMKKLKRFTSIPPSPLYAACGWGFSEIAELLLRTKGTDSTKFNEQMNRGLHLACENGHIDIVRMLLKAEVKPDIRTKKGWTALHLAANNQHVDVVKVLLEKTDINVRTTKEEWTALHLAAENGDVDILGSLLEAKVDVDAVDSNGRTALYLATDSGHEKAMAKLWEARTELDPNAEDIEAWLFLRRAVEKNDAKVVRVLLKLAPRVDVNRKDSHGMTLLNIAARNREADIVMQLVEKMADVNVKDSEQGRTALHWATWHGHTKMVTLLIKEKTMDINAQDIKGYTALHWATERGNTRIVELLLQGEKKVNVNQQDKEGWTSLHLAALGGHRDIMKVLLTNADVNIRNNHGRAALHYAARNGHTNCVKMLLDKQVDVKIQDNKGWMALHYAKDERREEIVKLLLDAESIANANI